MCEFSTTLTEEETARRTVTGGVRRTLTYDLNGNLTNDGAGKVYGYDAVNRLISITQGSNVTAFVYNGLGQRVQEKLNGAIIKQWIWTGGPQPAEERDASNNVIKRFYAQGEQIGGTAYFFTTDHLGSVREMTDATGAVRARYDYDPYGRITKLSGDLDADFGFTAFYRHLASGLDLALYRAYDPSLGRWLNRDPIAEHGGLGLYAYVEGNPVNWTDLLGLEILLESHPVAFGWNHAKVVIIPDNQARWSSDRRFSHVLPDGRHYATLGAGPDPARQWDLVSQVNRAKDLIRTHNKSSVRLVHPDIAAGRKCEDAIIDDLFDADSKYADNLAYDFFPVSWGAGWNSNSYTSGLLRATGFTEFPTPPHSPGFDKPLPPSAFGRKP